MTAVEWLVKKYFEDYKVLISELEFEQAKEMEKKQQERSYNEEDMNDYANYRLLIRKSLNPKEWFEQFKKK